MSAPQDAVTAHPEYERSYQHYLQHSGNFEEAARLSYQHTQAFLANLSAGDQAKGNSKGIIVTLSVLGGFAALAALLGVLAVLGMAAKSTSGAGDSSEKLAGMGEVAQDERFAFMVTSVECGKSRVGGVFLKREPLGQFCLVHVAVVNTSDKVQRLQSSDYHKAFNAAGQEYSVDRRAESYVNTDSKMFHNDINPGIGVEGTLVFDIPMDESISIVELHDSRFS